MSEDSHTFEISKGVAYPLPKDTRRLPYVGLASARLLEKASLKIEDLFSYLEQTEARMLKRFSSGIVSRRLALRELIRLLKRDVTRGMGG